jgi:hypothetical protein
MVALLLAACGGAPGSVPSDFVVSFDRGPCFGTCPVYTLTVSANGTVDYNGAYFVLAQGNQTASLTPSEVRKLHQAVLDADFFSMDDRYEVGATDLPSILTTVSMSGQSKSVYHYGLGCGTDLDLAPPGLCHLESLLEAIAVSNGWVSQ